MNLKRCAGNCGKYAWRNDDYCLTCSRAMLAKNKVEEFRAEKVQEVKPTAYYNWEVKPDPENDLDNRKVYYCFQGRQFVHEFSGGYIFALDRPELHHWIRLKALKTGDIIFHGTAQGVLAISVVESGYMMKKRPKEHYAANELRTS